MLATAHSTAVIGLDAYGGTLNGAFAGGYPWNSTATRWDADEGPVLTFQRRTTEADFRIWISTTGGDSPAYRVIQFDPTVGTPTPHASLTYWYHLPLPGTSNDGEWQEVSVNLQDLLDTYFPGVTFVDVNGVECRGDVDYDTFRVGHARTTRVYTLAPSALGGIISIRDLEYDSDYDTDNTDTWYHYDRLGNVMLTTDSTGASNGLRWQDAYGNQLAWEGSGAWAAASVADTPAGFITKPFDGDVGLVYGWARWYDPSMGTYVSRAPRPVLVEHQYQYSFSNPLHWVDTNGKQAARGSGVVPDRFYPGRLGRLSFSERLYGYNIRNIPNFGPVRIYWDMAEDISTNMLWLNEDERDAMRHCLLSCSIAAHLGAQEAMEVTDLHEVSQINHQSPVERRRSIMDIFNNSVSIDIGVNLCPGENCYTACYQALQSGNLITSHDAPIVWYVYRHLLNTGMWD